MKSVIVLTLFCGTAASLDADDRLEAVVATWRQAQQRFDTVRYQISGTVLRPKGFLRITEDLDPDGREIDMPAQDQRTSLQSGAVLHLASGRFCSQRKQPTLKWLADKKTFVEVPSDVTIYYNGAHFKSYMPDATNRDLSPVPREGTELSIYKGRPRVMPFGLEHNPILYACGTIQTVLAGDPSNLTPDLRADDFRLQTTADLNGRSCLVLRSVPDPQKRFYEYWVAEEDHRQILQVHGYGLEGQGKLWVTTRIHYAESEQGILPATWTIDRFEDTTAKALRMEMKLVDFQANPDVVDADFDVDPPPGTAVCDDHLPRDSRNYVVAAIGQPDLPVGEFEAQQGQQTSRRNLYLSLIVLAALLFSTYFLLRRRKRA